MMHKEQLAKLAKNIFHGTYGVKNQQLLHPNREWMVGLVIGISLFAASAIWGVLRYSEYRNLSIDESVGGEEVIIYRESVVEMALDQLRKRSSTYEQYLNAAVDAEVVDAEVNAVENTVTEVLQEEVLSEEIPSVLEESDAQLIEEVLEEQTVEDSHETATTTEVLLAE